MPAQTIDFEQRAARVGIVATLTLLSILGVITYRASVEQEHAARVVAHTHKVIEALQRVVGGVAEAESSVRAYTISRRQNTMIDFEPGIALAEQGLSDAQALTVDNPAQQRVLGTVAPLLYDRVRLLHERKRSVDRGESPEVSEEAQRLTVLIRTLVTEAINVERSLLQERDRVAEERAVRAVDDVDGGVGERAIGGWCGVTRRPSNATARRRRARPLARAGTGARVG